MSFKNPKPLPAGDPIRFATSDVDDAVWPILTNHPQKFEVNYRAADNTDVGTRPGRQFLASRSQGTRFHVGLDLFGRHRDVVVACETGRIISYYGFYPTSAGELSYALFIEHEDFVINYGEVKGDAQQEFGWRIGDRVEKGQRIARVSTAEMIHLETYIPGTTQNERWHVGSPRPQRLLNPTLYLLHLAAVAQGQPPVVAGGAVAGAGLENRPLEHPLLAGNPDLQVAALGQRPPFIPGDRGPAIGAIQDALDRVLPPKARIKAGSNRGIYGPKTQTAVRVFQRGAVLEVDGKIGADTLRRLDDALVALDGSRGTSPSPGIATPPGSGGGGDGDGNGEDEGGGGGGTGTMVAPAPVVVAAPAGGLQAIMRIAAESSIASYRWLNRGRAPAGYIKGMALVFARAYCKLRAGEPLAVEMARADTGNAQNDALTWYRQQFQDAGMSNAASGADTLRHLFVLMLGLGMRESSGKHCTGRDTTASNTTADTAEAGLFQTSWNVRSCSPLLPPLFQHYRQNEATGFLEVFREGVTCTPANWQNFGTGNGKEYQRLSKECPAFHVEFTAVVMRKLRRHWGPINRREAEVKREADQMFREVQAAVDASGLCPLVV